MNRMLKPKQRPLRRVPAVLVGGLSASLTSIFLFGKLSDEILEREAMAFDTRLVHIGRKMRNPGLDRVMSVATSTGEPWALAVVSGLAGLLWIRKQRYADVVTLLLAVVGGGAVNQVLKTFFRRDRPALRLRRAHASGYSYPSGHAMTTLACYGAVAFLIGRHGSLTKQPKAELIWLPTLVLCGLVGCSRVYLEVHYPTDVVGGWAVGTVWLSTCCIARSFMEPEES